MAKVEHVTLVRGKPSSVAHYISRLPRRLGPIDDLSQFHKVIRQRFVDSTQASILVEDEKVAGSLDPRTLKGLINQVYILQGERHGHVWRSLARRCQIVYCDPPPKYKESDWASLVSAEALAKGITLSGPEVRALIDRARGDLDEIRRCLTFASLAGIRPIQVLDLGGGDPLEFLDQVLRHQYDKAAQNLHALMQEGFPQTHLFRMLDTRFTRILRIRGMLDMGVPAEFIIREERLSRMVAGNFLSEARMNSISLLRVILEAVEKAYRAAPFTLEYLFVLLAATHTGV